MLLFSSFKEHLCFKSSTSGKSWRGQTKQTKQNKTDPMQRLFNSTDAHARLGDCNFTLLRRLCFSLPPHQLQTAAIGVKDLCTIKTQPDKNLESSPASDFLHRKRHVGLNADSDDVCFFMAEQKKCPKSAKKRQWRCFDRIGPLHFTSTKRTSQMLLLRPGVHQSSKRLPFSAPLMRTQHCKKHLKKH